MPVSLGPILDHLPAWLMVLFRLTGIFLFAPMLSSQIIPRHVKVFLVVGLSFCVYPMLLNPGTGAAASLGYVIDNGLQLYSLIPKIALELLLGITIGYAANLPIIGVQIGGYVIDQQMGLALAQAYNPDIGDQATIISQTLFLFALAIFIMLGGERIMFGLLIESFQHIPLGSFHSFESALNLIIGIITIIYDLAIQIAAPLICLLFLVTLSLGFIARTMPQLNILSVGFSLRILVSALILIISVGMIVSVYIDNFYEVFGYIREFITQ
ncbi:flagellar biosynthetic protein FliR [Poriferisphaera sp. WC338]|uniref:flagellar biosynthetic protein FliR n=1 Tax=Poriferisphaera sp. WC338 TaxID=3425129 RepID=UPI003D814AAC